MLRHIPLGDMYNLRDLGGYPAAGGAVTAWERFLRGDNPMGLSDGDLRWLLGRDITTVIDLRSAEEVARRPDQLSETSGFFYHHCAFLGGELVQTREEDVGRGYFEALDRGVSVLNVMRLILSAPGGVLFHCTAGKDRTGMIAMLLESLAGVGRLDILADYQVSETYLEELVRHMAATWPEMPAFAGQSRSAYMEQCMDMLTEKYGSIPGYLRAIGLTEQELDALRAKLFA